MRAHALLRARRGFTLMEMAIVLLVLTVISAVVVPAMISFGADKPLSTADIVLSLLKESRKLAIHQSATVTVLLDPVSGHFRVDSVSAMGAGIVTEDTLPLAGMDQLESELPRLRYVFSPSGAAFGDSLTIRGIGPMIVVQVDPLSGLAYAQAR